jgi:hypothetical protein
MSVEASPLYPSDLNAAYPGAADDPVEGDDHLRNIKTVLKTTFPNVSGAVTPTHTQLNYVAGVTSAIQTQFGNVGLQFISEASASASAAIDFTTGIDSTYDEYELHIINAVPTGGSTFWLRTTADAGSNWAATGGDYGWELSSSTGTTGAVTNGSTTATRIELTGAATTGTASAGGFSAVIRIFDPSATAANKRISWNGSNATGTAMNNLEVVSGCGIRGATAAINGIRVLTSVSTIASGKFKLFGVKK